MAEHRAERAALAPPPAALTIQNTLEPLEGAGRRWPRSMLGDEEGHTVVLKSEGDLARLPASVRAVAAAAA
jgi:hypothetical protein